MEIRNYLDIEPYSLDKKKKKELFNKIMPELTREHYKKCEEYRKLLDGMQFDVDVFHEVEEFPFVPVRLFKEYDLKSVESKSIIKTMTSSGTSGQRVSKIYLDKDNAANQTVALTRIMSNFIGDKRLPMLIIDSSSVITNRELFSARGAGILGFSMLGHHVTYAFDEHMKINIDKVQAFLDQYKNQDILVFGFTYIIWLHFIQELKKLKANGIQLNINRGILLHGGGFKKLEAEAVDNQTFKNKLQEVCGIRKVYNYYGMVEQTGSIYVECEYGQLHTSVYSDVIIRNAHDLSVCPQGKKGLVQLVSMLPVSYPGHSILTEDIGEITGEDDCPCGRCGKTIRIYGRAKQAESRGCSDTYSAVESKSHVNVQYFAGCQDVSVRCTEPYSEHSVSFINEFSKLLLSDKEARSYPDLMSLAYWCRKSNIYKLKLQYENNKRINEFRLGRGMVFHVTPSNVPVNFMFSYLFGLLSGNSNIVRVSEKENVQRTVICRLLNELFDKPDYYDIKEATSMITYDKNDEVTQQYTLKADVRIVWGGNRTVSHMRGLKSKEKSVEIVFADRYSFAVFDSDSIYLYSDNEMREFAHRFYNDTYLMDQNACSSPHLILWMCKNKDKSIANIVKARFYKWLKEELDRYTLEPVQLVDKYTMMCQATIDQDMVAKIDYEDPLLYRIQLNGLPDKVSVLRGKFGMFYEYDVDTLDDLIDKIDTSIQTVVCEGIDKERLRKWVVDNGLQGIDRIVQTGKSLDIGVYWDGYDIMNMMSRGITLS